MVELTNATLGRAITAEWKKTDPHIQRRAIRVNGELDHSALCSAMARVLVKRLPPLDLEHRIETHRGHDESDESGLIESIEALEPPAGMVLAALISRTEHEHILAVAAPQSSFDLPSLYRLLTDFMVEFLEIEPAKAEPEVTPGPPSTNALDRRRRWWAGRLPSVLNRQGSDRPPSGPVSVEQVTIDASRWARLESSGLTGQIPELTVLAALTDAAASLSFAPVPWLFPIDLRKVLDVPVDIGPLSDRILLGLGGSGRLGDQLGAELGRAHAEILTSAMRFVPFDDIAGLVEQSFSGPQRVWEFLYCPRPADSSHTRSDPGLAKHGISIELFREARLALGQLPASRKPIDVVARFAVAETDSAAGGRSISVAYRSDDDFGRLAARSLEIAESRLAAA